MSELEILREFYNTVKKQADGIGGYYLTFSNAVKDALDKCNQQLASISSYEPWTCVCGYRNNGFRKVCGNCKAAPERPPVRNFCPWCDGTGEIGRWPFVLKCDFCFGTGFINGV